MPDPDELLAVARSLADDSATAPSDAALRRAVSTIYYALFHVVLRAAALRFVGADSKDSAAYALLYRSFEHTHLRTMFVALDVPTLNNKLAGLLRRSSVSPEVRAFASIFVEAQEKRHLADYHPSVRFTPSDVQNLLVAAAYSLYDLYMIEEEERTDILALLMVKVRS